MFAFAVIETRQIRSVPGPDIFLAHDPLGIKPLRIIGILYGLLRMRMRPRKLFWALGKARDNSIACKKIS